MLCKIIIIKKYNICCVVLYLFIYCTHQITRNKLIYKTEKMKNSALQLARQIVSDNKSFIEGNIAEYLIQEVDVNENNFFQYLTDEEIEKMNGNQDKWHTLSEEVNAMIRENFDFDIERFVY